MNTNSVKRHNMDSLTMRMDSANSVAYSIIISIDLMHLCIKYYLRFTVYRYTSRMFEIIYIYIYIYIFI